VHRAEPEQPQTEQRVRIVGCGPGSATLVTPEARRAVAEADLIVGAPGLQALFEHSTAERQPIGRALDATVELVAERRQRQRVVVLVSGDPGLFSLAARLRRCLGATACDVVPGISAVQLGCARLGLDWHDLLVVSAHGRTPPQQPDEIVCASRIAVLLGHTPKPWLQQLAGAVQRSGHRAVLCQNLSLAEERIDDVRIEDLLALPYSPRSLLLLVREEAPA
jgi:precorrin-6y C5,15-methyltransferase (decarboxylating) CbiE subunit